jgi:hypothetical protein
MSKVNSANRRNFLLGFFHGEGNETLELNGFVLFKHWNGSANWWTVDIYTPESYKAMKERSAPVVQKETLF